MKKDFITSSLLGGLFIGLLSGVPYVRYGNCFCCMWKIGGGILAAGLYFAKTKEIVLKDGFLLGLLAGVIGFVISGAIFLIQYIISGASILGQFSIKLQNIELAERYLEYLARAPLWYILFMFFSEFFTGILFGSLGGIIGSAIFSSGNKPQK